MSKMLATGFLETTVDSSTIGTPQGEVGSPLVWHLVVEMNYLTS